VMDRVAACVHAASNTPMLMRSRIAVYGMFAIYSGGMHHSHLAPFLAENMQRKNLSFN
jgi:hypothetical protein